MTVELPIGVQGQSIYFTSFTMKDGISTMKDGISTPVITVIALGRLCENPIVDSIG